MSLPQTKMSVMRQEALPIAVIDLETTGLSPWRHDRVVEIGVVLMSPSGVVLEEYETLINPMRDVGPTRIHGITATDILSAPLFEDVAGDVAELLAKASVVAGHNISFDRNFLLEEFARIDVELPEFGVLCTCRLSGRSSLQACCEQFGIAFEGRPHRALDDARATARLLSRLIEDHPLLLAEHALPKLAWPAVKRKNAKPLTRDLARKMAASPPTFVQRLVARSHRDVEEIPENELAYLTLIDRVLEDRVIDQAEEQTLVEAAARWGFSQQSVRKAHRNYLLSLAAHALADGSVSSVERSDLLQVATLLGHDPSELDSILAAAERQLNSVQVTTQKDGLHNELHGLSVCFTGELLSNLNGQAITREMAEALAAKSGLTVSRGVTKKLDLLVVADPNTQSTKARKAREYGTRILAEDVFWRTIGVPVESYGGGRA